MTQKSIFTPGSDAEARGGLDRNLGPPAGANSNLPKHIANVEVETDEEMGTVVDCKGKDAGQPVCEIKKAEDAEKAAKATATKPKQSNTGKP